MAYQESTWKFRYYLVQYPWWGEKRYMSLLQMILYGRFVIRISNLNTKHKRIYKERSQYTSLVTEHGKILNNIDCCLAPVRMRSGRHGGVSEVYCDCCSYCSLFVCVLRKILNSNDRYRIAWRCGSHHESRSVSHSTRDIEQGNTYISVRLG